MRLETLKVTLTSFQSSQEVSEHVQREKEQHPLRYSMHRADERLRRRVSAALPFVQDAVPQGVIISNPVWGDQCARYFLHTTGVATSRRSL